MKAGNGNYLLQQSWLVFLVAWDVYRNRDSALGIHPNGFHTIFMSFLLSLFSAFVSRTASRMLVKISLVKIISIIWVIYHKYIYICTYIPTYQTFQQKHFCSKYELPSYTKSFHKLIIFKSTHEIYLFKKKIIFYSNHLNKDWNSNQFL